MQNDEREQNQVYKQCKEEGEDDDDGGDDDEEVAKSC